jgi:hypothetical protein
MKSIQSTDSILSIPSTRWGGRLEVMTAPEKPVMRVRRWTLLRQAGCNGGSTIAEAGGPSGKSSDSMKSIQSTDSILSITSTG